MKENFKLFIPCVLFFTIIGCASVAGNNSRTVSVASSPAGANIYVDNQRYGTTPAAVNLPTYIYGGKSVTLKKSGYKDHTVVVNSKFQPIALLDVLFWPAFLIDAATGSLVRIDPANANIGTTLERA